VLLVDDDHFNQTVLTQFMTKSKIPEIESAFNGLEAYELYKKHAEFGKKFDVITMDYEMPKMKGDESLRLIRDFEKRNGLAPCLVIMMSAYEPEDLKKTCVAENNKLLADHFLRKPIRFDKIQNILKQKFSQNKQER